MSRFFTKVESLHGLSIEALPHGKTKGTFLRNGTTTVLVDEKGRFYSSAVRSKVFYAGYSPGVSSTLELLAKHGFLSKAAVKEHTDAAALQHARWERGSSAKFMLSNAKTLGLKLTKAQQAAIDKAIAEEGVR